VVYATLADGRNEHQLLELDRLLAPDAESADALLQRANMEAMKALQGTVSGLQPPRSR
jgi:hypothetical protein